MATTLKAPVALILGAGPRVGTGVATSLSAKGYKIALVSRKSPQGRQDGHLHIQGDLSNPDSISGIFRQVSDSLGIPSVVVYNAFAMTVSPKDDPLSLSTADLTRSLQTNVLSVVAAAHQATLGFDKLPQDAARTFIYTGNRANIAPIPGLLDLGISKAAAAHIIAHSSQAYQSKGYRFYYADERKPDGSPAYGGIDGDAHGKFYAQLTEDEGKIPWLATFVKGTGYVKFHEIET